MQEKVLVCITAQSNSKRLIEYGKSKAEGGELHILYVIKGGNVFENEDTPRLLDELFSYAGSLGGTVHSLCGEDIPNVISGFVRAEGITTLVMGEPPQKLQKGAACSKNVMDALHEKLNKYGTIKIIIVERTKQQNESL
ncbi:MAG: hypothetical protein IJC39_04300 [Firmicutes bacterium]|nr:hypothetical protein [Bacillota bacterium]